jgi:hypothetical protein
MQLFIVGLIIGWLGHYTYLWVRRRTIFHTTSYTTGSGKTSYVSYTWPKNIRFTLNKWPFRKAEEVFAGKRRGRKQR